MMDLAALKRLLTGTLTPFELRVDHQLVGRYRTKRAALAKAPDLEDDSFANWDVRRRVGSRVFNVAFGYRSGTTSIADLVRMGVPVSAALLSEQKL